MSYEDDLAAIQEAVQSGQMTAREGVAYAQKAKAKYEDPGIPFGTIAGGALGTAAAGAIPGARSPLGLMAGGAIGGTLGALLDGKRATNMDIEDNMGAALGGGAGAVLGGMAASKLGLQHPAAKIAALAAGAGLGTLGSQALTQDARHGNELSLGRAAQGAASLAGMGAGGVGGGLAASALAPKVGLGGAGRVAATGLGALLGATAGDAAAAGLSGGDMNMTPELAGMAGGALLGRHFGGVPGAIAGGAAGGVLGEVAGAPGVGAGLAAAGAALHPKVASALAAGATKAREAGRTAKESVSRTMGGDPLKKTKAEFTAAGATKEWADEASSMWKAAEAKNPEFFAALSPAERATWMKKLAEKDEEMLKWFRGRFGPGTDPMVV